MNAKTLKMTAASAGTAALIAMGGLGLAANGWAEPEPAPPGPVQVTDDAPEATLPETSTEAAAPSEPTVASASPEITGPAALPEEEQGLPG